MKKLAIVLSLAALAGCAAPPPGPPNYGTRAGYTDPNGWQVVSVTPVPLGTGARVAANGDPAVTTGAPAPVASGDPAPTVAYAPPQASSTTVVTQQPIYVPQPVYVSPPVYYPAPVYAPAPIYSSPYWWPPISIGLGFSWSHWSGGHGGHWGGHGGHYGGHGGGHGHH